ncbi:MAG: cobamide remodeling phosphodiesterase CbiR [Pseudothermotoga sp.]
MGRQKILITHLSKKQLIGTTSWLVPGTYYENAKLVSGKVDFVELLVYTWDEQTQELVNSEIDRLNSLTEHYGLFYTVHLPTDSIESVFEAHQYFEESKLKVLNYVVHPIPGVEKLLLFKGSEVSLENLKEKIVYHEKMAFDIGHHLLGEKFDSRYLKNVEEIHLMGVDGETDHLPIDENTLHRVRKIFGDQLKNVHLLCIEVFDFEDMNESLKVLKTFLISR